jgi:hypothetical protein
MTDELLTPPVPSGPFFRFPDETTGMAALDAAGLLTEEGDPITASHTHALDVIGTISIGGEYDPETGDVITPPTVLDGWHCNYMGDLPDGWQQYVVTPEQPVRVFAA